MPTTWIVTGDASRARILQVTGQNRLEEIESFVNPKGRMSERELTTDAHPRFRGTAGPGSDRQETGAAEHQTEAFAKEIDRYLEHARVKRRFDRLFIVAPPRFLGMVRRELGKELQKLVQDEIDKDLSALDPRDIDRFLKGNGTAAKYP